MVQHFKDFLEQYFLWKIHQNKVRKPSSKCIIKVRPYLLPFLPLFHGWFIFFELITPVWINFLVIILLGRWCTSETNKVSRISAFSILYLWSREKAVKLTCAHQRSHCKYIKVFRLNSFRNDRHHLHSLISQRDHPLMFQYTSMEYKQCRIWKKQFR